MKRLQALLETLLVEVERETTEHPEPLPSLGPPPGPEDPGAPRVQTVRDKLRPIVQELQVHRARLEDEGRILSSEMARISRLSRFQEAEIKALIESLPDAVMIGTQDGLSVCNASALRILGIPSIDLIQRLDRQIPCLNLRWPGGQAMTEAELPFVRALQGETVIEEYQCTRPDTGAEVHLRAAAAPIMDGAEVVGAVTVGTDITDQINAQAKIAALNEHLDQLVNERTIELTQANAALARALAEVETLKERLEAENAYLQVENDRQCHFDEVVGQSDLLKEVFDQIETVAPQDTTVLLLGETGTGKGMMARAIHARSARNMRPMVMVNCTALPANLIESELFGREKGAFTGADSRQTGRFELADKGTLFLDEVGDLPLEMQAKLLQVLQEKEFCRLGSSQTIRVDVRIIAATNRDLKEEMANGRFREDLYYRLNIFPVTLPPLRHRKEDIPLLVELFMKKFNRKMGKEIKQLSAATLGRLVDHSWPGNVRELENVIERAVINTRGDTLRVLDRFDPIEPDAEDNGCQTLAELERAHILKVLKQTRGRIDGKNGAAAILGLNPSTLRGRMRKDGIERFEWAAGSP